ncbi:MAG: hypothetical protein QOC82_3608 [Frankiaceae bacterium]|nr:hypothetical protein [Frankiaceae bacterium]
MNALPTAAVALGDEIERFGSYFGYAAIIGLGVLSLLYFAQAREVRRLREWAGRAPERDAELALRVQSDAQRRVVATPMAPATTAAQQAEAARTAAAAALYAKVPAPPPPPAPLVGPPGQLARPPVVPGALPAQATAPGTTTPAPGTTTSAPAATTPAPAATTGPGAVTPAAAAAAAAAPPSAFANGAGGQDTHESPAAKPDPLEGPLPVASFDDEDDDGGFGFSPGRTGAIIGGAVAAVLVAVVLMVALNQGNDSPSKPNELGVVTQPAAASPALPAPNGTSTNATAAPAVDRRGTRVAVLNGTTQTGLARAVADQVEKARFTIAATATNADQAVPTTTVAYRDGSQRAAQIVAQVIGVGTGSVQPVDANSSAAADADVVVIVGADKIG